MTDREPDIRLTPRHELSEEEALERLSRRRARPVSTQSRRLSTSIGRVTKGLLKDEAPGIGILKARWQDIVGERLARVSTPEKLSGKPGERVLTLQIIPAAAPMFQHHGEALRQKLSVMLGGELKSIRLVQDTKAGGTGKSKRPALLPLSEQRKLEAALTNIKNRQLSEALLAFGKAVYTDET